MSLSNEKIPLSHVPIKCIDATQSRPYQMNRYHCQSNVSDMGQITLENNALDYRYLPKMCIELAQPLLDFVKVIH